jgi:hypothetical protein
MTITIDNAYPSYGPDVAFAIQNTGNIPVKVHSIKLTSLTTPDGNFTPNLDVDCDHCDLAYMVKNDGTIVEHRGPWDPGFDDDYAFTIVLSSTPWSAPILGAQIEPGNALAGDVGLHVAQSAKQSPAQYSFTIVFTFCNWNE